MRLSRLLLFGALAGQLFVQAVAGMPPDEQPRATPKTCPPVAASAAASAISNVYVLCAGAAVSPPASGASGVVIQTPPATAASSAAEERLRDESSARIKLVSIALGFAALLALVAVILAITSVLTGQKTGGFRVVGHWGGFGGSAGGWRMSAGLAGLLVAAAIALGAVMLVVSALQAISPAAQVSNTGSAEKKQDSKWR